VITCRVFRLPCSGQVKTNLHSICENMRKPDEMEPSQIKQQVADLTERANALRGYL